MFALARSERAKPENNRGPKETNVHFRSTIIGLALGAALACSSALADGGSAVGSEGTLYQKNYDSSNVVRAPVSCRVTVTTTATLLSTLMGSGLGDGCTQPAWAMSAYVKAPNSNLPAFCYSQESSLTSACLRGQEVPGWTDYPVPAAGLSSTYFVVPSGTTTLIVEWRG